MASHVDAVGVRKRTPRMFRDVELLTDTLQIYMNECSYSRWMAEHSMNLSTTQSQLPAGIVCGL
jgi:hypothetical protein